MGRDHDGTDSDSLDCGSPNVSGNELTICAWVYWDGFSDSVDQRAIMKGSSADSADHVIMIGETAIGGGVHDIRSRINVGGTTTTTIGNDDPFSTGAWFCLMAIRDGDTITNYYVQAGGSPTQDGQQTGVGTGDTTTNSDELDVAKIPSAGGGNLDGKAAECFLTSTALTANQRLAIAHGINAFALGIAMVLFLPIYGSHSPEIDYSGNGNTGAVNGTTKSIHPPVELVENYL